MALEPDSHNAYTVGWICAQPKELTAATAILDHTYKALPSPANDNNTYTLGAIGEHNVVITCLPKGKAGTNQAAAVAAQMAAAFPSIKVGLLVGVGSGIPPNVRLGDVVVGTPVGEYPGVVQWDMGKAEKEGKFKRTGSLNSPPNVLLTALTKLESRQEMCGTKIPEYLDELKAKWPRLGKKYSWTGALKDPIAEEDEEEDGDREPGEPHIHYGLIASGNQVIQDADMRDKLNGSLGGDVLCLETEAAGLMDFPSIAIRGICDYADARKCKDWQEYSAAVAAGFAKELLEEVQPGHLDKEKPLKDLLNKIHDDVAVVRAKLDRKEDLEILDWITTLEYDAINNDFFKRRQPGTGQWLLESQKYQTFSGSTPGQVLFCPGMPGSGKTILSSTVIHDLKTRFSDGSVGIAYMYCNFKRKEDQDLDSVLRSLLRQLLQGRSSLPQPLMELFKECKRKKRRASFDEIVTTFHLVTAIYTKVFIVIDALDEWTESVETRGRFLTEIFKLHNKCDMNIFATSRFIPEVTDRFKCYPKLEIQAHEDDIRSYLDGKIVKSEESLLLKYNEEIKKSIVEIARGMFLLAQLHFEAIKTKTTLKKLRAGLKALPSGEAAYDCAYQDAMARIEVLDADHRCLAKQVLSWIVYSRRPLTTLELQHAIAVEIGETDLDNENFTEVSRMVSVCTGLVTVDEESNIIRLVHYTTQEYFERTRKKWFPTTEADITRICITYLSYSKFANGPLFDEEAFETRLQENSLYKYAALNWGSHARYSMLGATPLVLSILEGDDLKFKAWIQVVTSVRPSKSHRKAWKEPEDWHYPEMAQGLHFAAAFGLVECIEVMLPKCTTIEIDDGFGRTPMSWATLCRQEDAMKLLFKHGAKLTSIIGEMPLLCWAANSGHLSIVKLLLELGARPDECDLCGQLARAASNGHEEVVGLLLTNGANVDGIKINGGFPRTQGTPLWEAAKNHHIGVVRILLDLGADPNQVGIRRTAPLYEAVGNGATDISRLLIDKGAITEDRDHHGKVKTVMGVEEWHPRTLLKTSFKGRYEALVNIFLEELGPSKIQGEKGYYALLDAAKSGMYHKVTELVKQCAGTKFRDDCNDVALAEAARTGLNNEIQIIEFLLGEGASIEGRDKDGRTALIKAACYGDLELIKFLLEHGADLENKDRWGQTALATIASVGDEEFLEIAVFLVRSGSNIETRNAEGQTPLAIAAKQSLGLMHLLLLKLGADPGTKDDLMRTPLMHSVKAFSNYVSVYDYCTLIDLIAKDCPDIDARDVEGNTALSLAAALPYHPVVEIMKEYGADVECRNNHGRTPLILAITPRGAPVVEFLLEWSKSTLEVKDDRGYTPLLAAASLGSSLWKVTKVLLSYGADVDATDKTGRTPLSFAASVGCRKTAKMLIEAGAKLDAKDDIGRTPFQVALDGGQAVVAQLLFDASAGIRTATAEELRKLEDIKAAQNETTDAESEVDGDGDGDGDDDDDDWPMGIWEQSQWVLSRPVRWRTAWEDQYGHKEHEPGTTDRGACNCQ
ncbi:hypothetical protein H072_10925 [Dactylellina haptotyla CBS 200.50]|uniref:Uncharacterized protein n=1 Tax=Dactylellina haptotyla (strain CBS 200.50) TaxID=1284197 RepID=S8B9A8_DACHA|nr:hypothetical protein H072_10925 [Dactylellina haptotyla CBS 200.50]